MKHNHIAYTRKEKGISQHELALDIGVSRGFLSEVENGRRKLTNKLLSEIADVLDVEEGDLV